MAQSSLASCDINTINRTLLDLSSLLSNRPLASEFRALGRHCGSPEGVYRPLDRWEELIN
jgi:hypothetical protein